ncbi:MAG TPA: hypothetical protein VGE76_20485 [Opitutaceae bacterium]
MKTRLSLLVGTLLLALAAGCSTVDSRIEKNRAAFNTWPPAVQDRVVKGEIDIGFTTEQVRVALGEPDRVFSRTSADGTSQIWSYRDRGPKFGFGVGVGMGSFGSRGGSFGSVGINTGSGYHDDEKMGVVFDERGVVKAIETRGK